MPVKVGSVALLVVLLALIPATAASAQEKPDAQTQRAEMRGYAEQTWDSFVAMTDRRSGLPADILNSDGTKSVQTSTTNIGAYMWSAVAAHRIGIISYGELIRRMRRTIRTLEQMERYGETGQFYNWYDHRTGEKLTSWPPAPDSNFNPILSSVDNAWLAVGLKIVRNSVRPLARRAGALYDAMDWGFYYRPEANRVLFHYQPEPEVAACCYDTLVSESRIVDYLGIIEDQMPDKTYYGRWRTFPDTCDWSWQETRPIGEWQTYFGVDVFEGAYPYAGTRLVPSWGGSMFEALMPALFIPEETWAPQSWGANHPLTVNAQVHHGMEEAGYGYWGFSPANNPAGNYGVWGVDGAGLDPGGMPSNIDNTLVDRGYDAPGCERPAAPDPPQSAYTNGVVTPHAAFLALRYAPETTLDNLRALASDFPGLYGKWGFRDSVNVDTGQVSDAYLSLDQGMIMAALGNALTRDDLRRFFADKRAARELMPVIGAERFNTAGEDSLTLP